MGAHFFRALGNGSFLQCSKAATVTVTLSQTSKEPFDTIGLYVCKSKPGGSVLGSQSELGPGLSPVVRPKNPNSGSKRGSKDGAGSVRAQRIKVQRRCARQPLVFVSPPLADAFLQDRGCQVRVQQRQGGLLRFQGQSQVGVPAF